MLLKQKENEIARGAWSCTKPCEPTKLCDSPFRLSFFVEQIGSDSLPSERSLETTSPFQPGHSGGCDTLWKGRCQHDCPMTHFQSGLCLLQHLCYALPLWHVPSPATSWLSLQAPFKSCSATLGDVVPIQLFLLPGPDPSRPHPYLRTRSAACPAAPQSTLCPPPCRSSGEKDWGGGCNLREEEAFPEIYP